jgi:hypothetical protein
MSEPLDRFHVLLDQDKVTGIDFVHVEKDQVNLKVYFFQSATVKPNTLLATVIPGDISIRSASKTKLPVIPVKKTEWEVIDGRDVLKITTLFPGDFTWYRLRIESQKVDPYFNDIVFSFKVNCPSDLDCKTREHECPPEQEADFPIDYMARDFWSFRRALLDFASLKYPDWKERLEADAGIMLAEVMSALGDEMAYYQDRIGREAYLETATQRRSVRRHARLIDYNIDDGQGASTWLDCKVIPDSAIDPRKEIPEGSDVWAVSDSGKQTYFEIGFGLGLGDSHSNKIYITAELNSLFPYIQDEDNVCLPVGCTDMFLQGPHANALQSSPLLLDEENGKWVLLQTNPEDASIPARRHMVRLIKAEDTIDPLNGQDITHIAWENAQALPFEICMKCNLEIHGNMVPVTAGKLYEKLFIIGPKTGSDFLTIPLYWQEMIDQAIEREGRDGSVTYLFSLPGSEEEPLAWSVNDKDEPVPQVDLIEIKIAGSGSTLVEKWECRRSLVGTYSSDSDDPDYTLDDGTWKRVVGYQRDGSEIVHIDYASGEGTTIRFGDGEFGNIPAEGTIFKVTYRLGGGAKSNVPADSIIHFDSSLTFIRSIRNPLPAVNGRDPESLGQIRKLAPYRFRSITERAVIPGDYAQVAERLDWVQKAGASFRWTGSWLSAFVTPDPKGSVDLTSQDRKKLIRDLDLFRQAGREVHVMKPNYADLNLEITICVAPGSYRGEVKEKILEALTGKSSIQRKAGYFSADRFTFGMVLNRSHLEAVIQSVPGVNAVIRIRFKRRGWFPWTEFKDPFYDPGKDTIIRIENDPLFPERGSVKLIMEGGA